jgi:hypothetical protein
MHTFVSLVHEFKQLVDDSLQELPMSLEETWVLSHNVHDVTSHNGFVVFATLHLGKTKKILNDSDQESLLRLLVHGT